MVWIVICVSSGARNVVRPTLYAGVQVAWSQVLWCDCIAV